MLGKKRKGGDYITRRLCLVRKGGGYIEEGLVRGYHSGRRFHLVGGRLGSEVFIFIQVLIIWRVEDGEYGEMRSFEWFGRVMSRGGGDRTPVFGG